MSEPQTPAQPIDYNFAREELMLKELNNDPIQSAIQSLERQHEEDKQSKSREVFLYLFLLCITCYSSGSRETKIRV